MISQNRDTGISYYHYDGLGSTRALSDSTGSVTDTYDYEAFGETLNSTGTTENNYLFTGEQFDQQLNQYYLRARYYDQGVGRFTQQDTWMGINSDPVTLHKYLYANVDPVNNIDPTGNFSMGSVMSAVNIMGSLSSAAVGGFRFGQIATGQRELSAREVGFTVLLLAAGPAAGKVASLLGRRVIATSTGVALTSGSIRLTEALIKRSLSNAQYVTRQTNISIPRLERFVKDMLNGDRFPPIKVDGNVIVEGHHRYIASQIANVVVDVDPGNSPSFSRNDPVRKLADMVFSSLDF